MALTALQQLQQKLQAMNQPQAEAVSPTYIEQLLASRAAANSPAMATQSGLLGSAPQQITSTQTATPAESLFVAPRRLDLQGNVTTNIEPATRLPQGAILGANAPVSANVAASGATANTANVNSLPSYQDVSPFDPKIGTQTLSSGALAPVMPAANNSVANLYSDTVSDAYSSILKGKRDNDISRAFINAYDDSGWTAADMARAIDYVDRYNNPLFVNGLDRDGDGLVDEKDKWGLKNALAGSKVSDLTDMSTWLGSSDTDALNKLVKYEVGKGNTVAAMQDDGDDGLGGLGTVLGLAASFFGAPYLSSYFGGGLLGSAGAGAVLGGGTSALTGGDVLKGALLGGLTGGISSEVTPGLTDALGGGDLGTIGAKAIVGAGNSALSGGDPLTGALTGAGSGLLQTAGVDLGGSAQDALDQINAVDTDAATALDSSSWDHLTNSRTAGIDEFFGSSPYVMNTSLGSGLDISGTGLGGTSLTDAYIKNVNELAYDATGGSSVDIVPGWNAVYDPTKGEYVYAVEDENGDLKPADIGRNALGAVDLSVDWTGGGNAVDLGGDAQAALDQILNVDSDVAGDLDAETWGNTDTTTKPTIDTKTATTLAKAATSLLGGSDTPSLGGLLGGRGGASSSNDPGGEYAKLLMLALANGKYQNLFSAPQMQAKLYDAMLGA